MAAGTQRCTVHTATRDGPGDERHRRHWAGRLQAHPSCTYQCPDAARFSRRAAPVRLGEPVSGAARPFARDRAVTLPTFASSAGARSSKGLSALLVQDWSSSAPTQAPVAPCGVVNQGLGPMPRYRIDVAWRTEAISASPERATQGIEPTIRSGWRLFANSRWGACEPPTITMAGEGSRGSHPRRRLFRVAIVIAGWSAAVSKRSDSVASLPSASASACARPTLGMRARS